MADKKNWSNRDHHNKDIVKKTLARTNGAQNDKLAAAAAVIIIIAVVHWNKSKET